MRRVAIAAEIGLMLIAATLAALTLGGVVPSGRSTRSPRCMGVGQAVDGPARHALVFQMVGPEDLANAVA